MIKSSLTLAVFSTLMLTACGGGGSAPASEPAPSKLAAYTGTWKGDCRNQTISGFTISEAAGIKDTVNAAYKVEFFAQPGCTGPVVATETYSTDMIDTYTATIQMGVVFIDGPQSVMTMIDQVTRQVPAYVRTTTGPNVVQKVNNGKVMTCVSIAPGTEVCKEDLGLVAAQAPAPAGLYRSGNKMYRLRITDGIYYASGAYTKQ